MKKYSDLLETCVSIGTDARLYACKSINKPFVCIPNDKYTVKYFIQSVISDTLDDAKRYLSRKLMSEETVDLLRLKNVMKDCREFKFLNFCRESDGIPAGSTCRSSVMLIGENKHSILHLYMIHEPDLFGNWKIYGIENERE